MFDETYKCETCGIVSTPQKRIPFMTEWECYKCGVKYMNRRQMEKAVVAMLTDKMETIDLSEL